MNAAIAACGGNAGSSAASSSTGAGGGIIQTGGTGCSGNTCTASSGQDLVVCYCDEVLEHPDPNVPYHCPLSCTTVGGSGTSVDCQAEADRTCKVVQLDITPEGDNIGNEAITGTLICTPDPAKCGSSTPAATTTTTTTTTTVQTTPTSTPTNTPTSTPTATPTVTIESTPTATPSATATPVPSCNDTCTTNTDCGGLVCSGGLCRSQDCLDDDSCNCVIAQSTPTDTPTGTVSTPSGETLPVAGFGLPTLGMLGMGILMLILGIMMAI